MVAHDHAAAMGSFEMRARALAWCVVVGAMLGAVAAGCWSPAWAQRVVPPSREAAQYSFAPIVKKAAPAVVNVLVRGQLPPGQAYSEDFRRFFGQQFGQPQQRNQSSVGSGVIVTADGLVVTNAHVLKVSGNVEVRLVLADKRELDARIILQDESSDIAVLRIDDAKGALPFLELADSDTVEVGDQVLAIGNPFGVGQTVTSGIISALGRTRVTRSDAQIFIQTDAAINPGNSGGALVDMGGRVVGINTAIFSRSGGSHGIGFAIPSNLVKLVVESAASGRKVERPWLGAKFNSVTRDMAERLNLGRVAGAMVIRIQANSPAEQAGLQPGDIVVAVDGHDIDDARSAIYRLTTRGVGNRAKLDVVRRGQRMAVDVALKSAPAPGSDDARDLTGSHPLEGVRVANIQPGIADDLGLEEQQGVVLVSVRQQSTAAKLGFQAGDVVLQVGKDRVGSVRHLELALKEYQRGDLVLVRRGTRVLRLQLS
jgi:Do/DeqQ family serine protease